jgi:hypothetical protein
MSETTRPQMPNARARLSEKIIDQAGFDVEIYHAMNARDNTLIENELILGSGSSAFVYSFQMDGKTVAGVSVIGARHVAATYGGIKHRFVTSTQKVGAMLIHKSYPTEGHPGSVSIEHHAALEGHDDFYECVVEISDIKTGNSLQVEKREFAQDSRRDGSKYDRKHYQLIAQSKAFRNGVLDIIPQDVLIKWKGAQLALGKGVDITGSVLEEARDGLVKWGTANALTLDRSAIERLTMDQLDGLKAAAQRGKAAFVPAAVSVGLMAAAAADEAAGKLPAPDKEKGGKKAAKGPDPREEPDFGPRPRTQQQDTREDPPHDPETGEIAAAKTLF